MVSSSVVETVQGDNGLEILSMVSTTSKAGFSHGVVAAIAGSLPSFGWRRQWWVLSSYLQ